MPEAPSPSLHFAPPVIFIPLSASDGDVDDADANDHDDHVDHDDHDDLALPVIFSPLLLEMVAHSCKGIGHRL